MSAVEWNASANMAELPVNVAATYFAIAIARFAMTATTTTFLDQRGAIVLQRGKAGSRMHDLESMGRSCDRQHGCYPGNIQNLPEPHLCDADVACSEDTTGL